VFLGRPGVERLFPSNQVSETECQRSIPQKKNWMNQVPEQNDPKANGLLMPTTLNWIGTPRWAVEENFRARPRNQQGQEDDKDDKQQEIFSLHRGRP
jgi:hypothetical protein